MSNTNDYTFLSWVRLGMGQSIQLTHDQLIEKAKKGELFKDEESSVPVSMTLVEQASTGVHENSSLQTHVRMFGPGEVTSIDRRQVIRTDPAPYSTNVEPNYFPMVEFDRPDFPWLLSPTCHSANKLLPWLYLVTVEKKDGVLTPPTETVPLPILHIANPVNELPDPTEAWA